LKNAAGSARVAARARYAFAAQLPETGFSLSDILLFDGDAIRRAEVLVYRVAPETGFGFGKGERFTQTRWSF